MKKSILVLIILALCLTSLFALTACNNGSGDGDLQYGVKYSYYQLDDDTHIYYYTFNNDGTGIQRRKDSSYDYILYFKYTFADNDKSAIACYFDKIEKSANTSLNPYAPDSSWHEMLLVSKNTVASSSSYAFFVNEDYLSEIPNYRG